MEGKTTYPPVIDSHRGEVTIVYQGQGLNLVEDGWNAIQLRHGPQSCTDRTLPVSDTDSCSKASSAEVQRFACIGAVPPCGSARKPELMDMEGVAQNGRARTGMSRLVGSGTGVPL